PTPAPPPCEPEPPAGAPPKAPPVALLGCIHRAVAAERGLAGARIEPAAAGAAERSGREAERGTALATQVEAVALLESVDRAVAAKACSAGAGVERAACAAERPAEEPERGAALA